MEISAGVGSSVRHALGASPLKLIATLQPTSAWDGRAATLYDMGFRGFRVNFAPASPDANAGLIRDLRAKFAETADPPVLTADIPGRKLRALGLGDPTEVEARTRLRFVPRDGVAGENEIRLSDDRLFAVLHPGDVVAVGDAKLVVRHVHAAAFDAEVTERGRIWNRCAVCAPEHYRIRTALLPEDLVALRGGAASADILCVSFADTPGMVVETRDELRRIGGTEVVAAKIETAPAVRSARAILAEADFLMVGRGDLSQFMDADGMDAATRLVVSEARGLGVGVILATDYFKSVANGETELSNTERRRLSDVNDLDPDYLVLNETTSWEHWRAAAERAVRWMDER